MLASRMIEHLQTEKLTIGGRILFFYFGHTDRGDILKNRSTKMMGCWTICTRS